MEEQVKALDEKIEEQAKTISELRQMLDLKNSQSNSNVSSTGLAHQHSAMIAKADFPKLDGTKPSFHKELALPPPTTEELSQAIIETQGQDVVVEGKFRLIHNSSKAHYYTTSVIPYGLVTLKVCLDCDVEEKKSYERSKEMIEAHNAIAMVVQPILSFKFRDKLHCYMFDQFKPFNLGVKMGPMLVSAQLSILNDIFRCLGFLIEKGGHGRVDNSSVCGLVLCHGRGMITDLKPKSWPIEPSTPDDYKAYGSVIERHARTLFNQNLPENLRFLITQLKQISFDKRPVYGCFDKHPIFYSNTKKMLYFMFGSTESEVVIALRAKANANAKILKGQNKHGSTFEQLFSICRVNEQSKVEKNLQKHLDIIHSYPHPVSPSPSSSGSPSASHPSSSSSLVSTLVPGCGSPFSPSPSAFVSGSVSPSPTASGTCSPSPSGSPSPTASGTGSPSPSASRFCWMNVYKLNSDIEKVWDLGDTRGVTYNYVATLDYLRFLRNVYAHILSRSQLNENQREGLFREVDKMWPGFIFALFVTLSEMDTILDG